MKESNRDLEGASLAQPRTGGFMDLVRRLENKLAGLSSRLRSWVHVRRLRACQVDVHSSVKFYGRPIITRHPNSAISIGARSVVCSHPRFTALGVSRPVILRTLSSGASIAIATDVGLSGTTICAAIGIEIGEGTLIGADATIVDTDFHPVHAFERRYLPMPSARDLDRVCIGRDVFVGAGAVVLKGVTIGDGAVIGARSVVTKNVPAGMIAAGNPASIVGQVAKATLAVES